MANIKGYDTPSLGLRPTDLGVDATAAAARRIGSEYNAAAEAKLAVGQRFARNLGQGIEDLGSVAVKSIDNRQISAGTAASAKLFDSLTQDWNNTAQNADPNDPSVAAKWREENLEPALEKFQSGFSTERGQAWALHRADQIREHMFHKTTADMSSLAGIAVHNNIRETANKYSNIAVTDPSSVPALLDHIDHDVEGIVASSPNLKGTDAARVRSDVSERTKEAIVKAGAFGAIQKAADPEAEAARWSQRFPKYINGAEELQLAKTAKLYARQNSNAEKQSLLLKKQVEELAVHKGVNDAFNKNVSIDATTGRTIVNPQFGRDILDVAHQHPDAPNAASVVKTYLDWGEAQLNRERKVVTNPTVVTGLMDRMSDPTNPTTAVDILKAGIHGDLEPKMQADLLAMQKSLAEQPIKSPAFKNAMEGVKAELGNGDLGSTRYHLFFEQFVPEVQRLEREGKLPPNALSLSDKTSLLNQMLDQYRLTPQQKMMDHITKNLGIGADLNGNIIDTLSEKPAASGPVRKIGNVEVPPKLRDIAALQHNSKTGQWRDQTSGIIYDSAGNEIAK